MNDMVKFIKKPTNSSGFSLARKVPAKPEGFKSTLPSMSSMG